jgi:hypothetical protein
MTKRHFIKLAEALRDNRPVGEGMGYQFSEEQWGDIAGRIADVCQEQNPRFDRAFFLEACKGGPVRIPRAKKS